MFLLILLVLYIILLLLLRRNFVLYVGTLILFGLSILSTHTCASLSEYRLATNDKQRQQKKGFDS